MTVSNANCSGRMLRPSGHFPGKPGKRQEKHIRVSELGRARRLLQGETSIVMRCLDVLHIYICVNSTHPTIDKNSEHVTLVQTGCMRAFMSVTGYIEKLRVVELTVTGDP